MKTASLFPKNTLDAYYYERDWGASMVAGEIASFLGLPGHYSVNVARVLMDFGRFPGRRLKMRIIYIVSP